MDARAIIDNVSKVVIGKEQVVTLAVTTLIAGGHLLLEDVPGVGKTTLARALAQSVSAEYKRLSLTPDVLPSDITGYNVFNRKTEEFEFKHGVLDCNFLLADEINRTSPKTQSSLLEAMQEGCVSVDGVTYEMPKPFMVTATQNPIEHAGTYPLPEAQLDRFMMKVSVGYPNSADEKRIVMQKSRMDSDAPISAVVSCRDVIAMQAAAETVYIADALVDYIVRIATRSRRNADIALGLSPRSCISLCRAAKAFAYIQGRDYVLPDDVKYLAPNVFRHRIIITREARMRGLTPDAVVDSLIKGTDSASEYMKPDGVGKANVAGHAKGRVEA